MPDSGLLRVNASAMLDSFVSHEEEPLISVALCTYNGSRYLSTQLDSLLAQTHTRLEIIAVDDASTDDTFVILEGYARRDDRVRVFRNPENLGYRRNFETALAKCRGEFIALCDQDDIWLPEKLSVLKKSIGDAMLAYCDSEMIDSEGQSLATRISDRMNMLSTNDPVPFVFYNCVSGHAMLIRRELLDLALPFPDSLYHDWWIAMVAASTDRVVYCDQCLVQYRQHSGAVTDMVGMRKLVKRLRPRGYKALENAALTGRLATLAVFSGPHQLFFRRLLDLWRARESQILSIRLAFVLCSHSERFFAMSKESRLQRWRRALRYAWGLRLMRYMKPHKYVC